MNNYLFSFTKKKTFFQLHVLLLTIQKNFSQKDANKLLSDIKVTSQISPNIKITLPKNSGYCRIDVIFS